MTAQEMVDGVLELTKDWDYTGLSVGAPGPVVDGKVVREPVNLGTGWKGSTSEGVRQADEADQRRRDAGDGKLRGRAHAVSRARHWARDHPDLRGRHRTDGTRPSAVQEGDVRGLRRRGGARAGRPEALEKAVFDTIGHLSKALLPDYVVLGGGNARELDELPPNCRLGRNEDAFLGGFRLWVAN
jgi:polyphosphate glucokinase